MNREDPLAAALVRPRDADLPVHAPRARHGQVQRVGPVRRQNQKRAALVHAIHLGQQRRHQRKTRVALRPPFKQRIGLVEEQHGRVALVLLPAPRPVKQRLHALLRVADILIEQLMPLHILKAPVVGLPPVQRRQQLHHGLPQQRLAASRRPVQQHPARPPPLEQHEQLRVQHRPLNRPHQLPLRLLLPPNLAPDLLERSLNLGRGNVKRQQLHRLLARVPVPPPPPDPPPEPHPVRLGRFRILGQLPVLAIGQLIHIAHRPPVPQRPRVPQVPRLHQRLPLERRKLKLRRTLHPRDLPLMAPPGKRARSRTVHHDPRPLVLLHRHRNRPEVVRTHPAPPPPRRKILRHPVHVQQRKRRRPPLLVHPHRVQHKHRIPVLLRPHLEMVEAELYQTLAPANRRRPSPRQCRAAASHRYALRYQPRRCSPHAIRKFTNT